MNILAHTGDVKPNKSRSALRGIRPKGIKMVTREHVIRELKTLGGVATVESKYYTFDVSQFEREIKAGANGFILKASGAENEVAVKFYLPRSTSDYAIEEDDYKRFMNEIAILENTTFPYLVKCFGKGDVFIKDRKVPYYVMPFANGSMRDLLDQGKFNDPIFAYHFFFRLGLAIQYLHNRTIIHRDLKPENILFMKDKEEDPLLADLGLAHLNPNFAEFEVDSARMLRNPYYCAPEQIFGTAKAVDHLADIYAYGYILREALTGEHPRGENAPLPSERIGSEFIALDALAMKCTEYEKQDRYRNMGDCLSELKIGFRGSYQEKEQAAALYIGRQKLRFLTRHWTLTSELLSAGNLKALYLMRLILELSQKEKTVIFHNLLLRGKGKSHQQRTKLPDTKTSMNSPAPLGWYWFASLKKDEILEMIRHALSHEDIFVHAQAIRSLGIFGGTEDVGTFRNNLSHINSQIASEALLALARHGTQNDMETIRKFQLDDRAKVVELLAYALSIAPLREPSDEQIINDLLEHANPEVKRAATVSLNRLKGLPISENAFDRKISQILLKYEMDDSVNQENITKANNLVMTNNFYTWNAGIRWFISQNLCGELEEILKGYGRDMRFAKLIDIDYYLYCPNWWREAID